MVQVRVHELEDEVEVPVVLRPVHVQQLDDVGMLGELLQEDDLAEGPLRVRLVPESVEYLLHSHHATRPAARNEIHSVTTYKGQREFETRVSQNFPINLTGHVPKLSQV